jgi:hypothetical protein
MSAATASALRREIGAAGMVAGDVLVHLPEAWQWVTRA